jgi:DNA-binding NarL/FixJ family response regulator
MVVVAVEDLLFSSKIRTVAKQLGVALAFARTPDEVMQKVRSDAPSLVVFDLNGAKTNPLDTIAAIKSEPATAGIRVLGFASHVDVDLIDAARRAGADDVLPRSAFASRLPDILAGA